MLCHPVPSATPEFLWAAETSDLKRRIPVNAKTRMIGPFALVRSRSRTDEPASSEVAFTFMLMQTVPSVVGRSLEAKAGAATDCAFALGGATRPTPESIVSLVTVFQFEKSAEEKSSLKTVTADAVGTLVGGEMTRTPARAKAEAIRRTRCRLFHRGSPSAT